MAKSRKNLIQPGMQFERWTVLESAPGEDKKWLCRCQCGTERVVSERGLLYGESKSCGCLRRDKSREASSHDLIGKVFGDLTVTGKAEYQRKNGGIWWRCSCACGEEYEVPGTLLVTGKRTNCGGSAHERQYARADITNQRFHDLVALYPTSKRDGKGFVIWHCRCDCGNEIDISYNALVYSTVKSCGCRKKEHEQKLHSFLTHIDGTSIDAIRSKKVPADNTTGYKGVYFIRGKYVAKIVFQKKQYFLGTYDNIEDAAAARAEAEETLFGGMETFYMLWEKRAAADPVWAAENPVKVEVVRNRDHQLCLQFSPEIRQGTDAIYHY